ncbi:acetyl-CoA hydrolase/transferase family protein [bacterium]|nr:MAG: acetyl-CoA hydrolase/transferase family protein [bacterium]
MKTSFSFRNAPHFVTPAEALQSVRSQDRVFVHSVAAAPRLLIEALVARAPELRGVEVVHMHTEGAAPYVGPEFADSFHHDAIFVGPNVRAAVNEGRADYVPVFLSEVPGMFRKGHMPIDVALIQVSPPDRHGFCSLGTSIDISLAAVQSASIVIAQINPNMPRTHGDGHIHVSNFQALVQGDDPLPEHRMHAPTEVEQAIAQNVAGLVEDGATLQMGIGGIPNAVLAALNGHRRLGVHTEMFSDGLIDLIESGAVTNEDKTKHRHRTVASFLNGTRRLYDFVDDNPSVFMLDIAYVNDTSVIRKLPKMTAINSALEVDLTGQIAADSIGHRQYSGIGGQMDFMRGASLSEGGKPIIALPSVTNKGRSRIVSMLQPGAGVVTTRGHAQYIVTEYGIAYLYGKNLRERARALIAIAHPDHREALEREAKDRGL